MVRNSDGNRKLHRGPLIILPYSLLHVIQDLKVIFICTVLCAFCVCEIPSLNTTGVFDACGVCTFILKDLVKTQAVYFLVSDILLCGYTTVCLPICVLMDI